MTLQPICIPNPRDPLPTPSAGVRITRQGGARVFVRSASHQTTRTRATLHRTVRGARDPLMSRSERRRPAFAQIVEVRLVHLDAMKHLRLERIGADHADVDRKPYSEVRAHRRIHRNEADLQRVVNVGSVIDRAVEDRLAVFMFPELKERHIPLTPDGIAARSTMYSAIGWPVIWPPRRKHRLKGRFS